MPKYYLIIHNGIKIGEYTIFGVSCDIYGLANPIA
jgi:hypothetical protein